MSEKIGGEQQILAVGRGLMARPKFLCLRTFFLDWHPRW